MSPFERETLRTETKRAISAAIRSAYEGVLTQTELATRLGTSQNTISRWATGESEPALADIRMIEIACGLEQGHILIHARQVPLRQSPEDLITQDTRLDRVRRDLMLAAYRVAVEQAQSGRSYHEL